MDAQPEFALPRLHHAQTPRASQNVPVVIVLKGAIGILLFVDARRDDALRQVVGFAIVLTVTDGHLADRVEDIPGSAFELHRATPIPDD